MERRIILMKAASWKNIRQSLLVFIYILMIYMAIRIEESHAIEFLFTYQFILGEFLEILFPFTVMSFILLIGIFIIVKKQPLSMNPVNKIASAVFAFFMLMGHCFNSIGAFFLFLPIFCRQCWELVISGDFI